MIRSLLLYSKYFIFTVFSPKIIFLWKDISRYCLGRNRYFKGKDLDQKQKALATARAVNWLLHAQRSTPDDGMGSYHHINGWSSSYPETTGYIIPTLLQYADSKKDRNITDSAMKAADWLISIQKPSGGWQGGRVNENKPEVVFNTAQIIRGMDVAYRLTNDSKYLESAIRAGDWLCDIQDDEGTWTNYALMGKARTYDSYVDYPLLLIYRQTRMEKYRNAAVKNIDWIIREKQHENGWFEDCDNTVKRNNKPILHTIAYTIDGLLDCGIFLGQRTYIEAAKKAADVLKEKFDRDGYLHGRYDKDWTGSEHMILTGCAQISIIWQKIAHYSGNRTYAESASKMNSLLVILQTRNINKESDNTYGALPGSYPLWGRYEPFAFPNWGTKYFSDALIMEQDNS